MMSSTVGCFGLGCFADKPFWYRPYSIIQKGAVAYHPAEALAYIL